MARKGILTTDFTTAPRSRPEAEPRAARGAVGALQSSLSKLQESAIQEIPCALIDDAGFEDRLGLDAEAQRQLVDSLRTYGQQVPVLLRPHAEKPGRYEIVYGRRRLLALKELGQPVKAMIRQLDDHALVMAQGQENTSRQDLSFIEKASFAAQLQEAGYDRQTISAALSVDLPMLSRMLKAGAAFPLEFLRQIGSAPGIGRERWIALARLFEDDAAKARAMAFMKRPEFATLPSDDRFEAVFKRASAKPEARPSPAPKPRPLRGSDGTPIGEVRATAKGVTLSVHARSSEGFDGWLEAHAEEVIMELHARWSQNRAQD